MLAPKTITQQGSRHPDCGSRPLPGPARCRALAASVLVAVTVLSVGCGDVLFVPSPYTPQNVDLIYSSQEDVSIVRWRISSTAAVEDDLKFQILGDDGYQTIVFSQSLFPGGGSTCADSGGGSCFQYVVRGQYPVDRFPRPIRAVHATYGTLPGELARASTEDQTLGVDPFFRLTNDQVLVSLTDTVAFDPPYVYPRSYDRSMWPTKGLCVSDVLPTSVSFSPLDTQTYGFPPDLPLSDFGMYCVGIRPTPSVASVMDDGGCPNGGYCPKVAQGRLETLPQVVDMHQTFTPPVEQSPVIYQIVLDLEIPVADRCTSSLQTIESLVDKYMHKAAVPVLKLPTINIATNANATGGSPNCAQIGEGRKLPATSIADAVLQAVSTFPQAHQQFHFLYFNNQNITLPKTLTDSLQALFNGLTAPAPYDLLTISWLFNPGLAAATGPTWAKSTAWQAADDPSFETELAMYVANNFPYTSQTYDSGTPVPLLSTADAVTFDGGFFKICQSTPYAEPVYTSPVELLDYGYGGSAWAIKASDPPGYFVNLPQVVSTPGPSFTPASASVHFQICSKDVIHSFWVPEFRLKEDAVPGKTTSIRLKPNRVGHYTVVCTELCGLGHSTMRSPVAVVSDQEFTAWLQRQTQPAPGAAPPASGGGGGGGGGGADLAQGKQLFTANGCGGCHTLADAGANGTVGPDLDKLASAASKFGKQLNESPVQYVTQSIEKPEAFTVPGFPKGVMPSTFGQQLTPQQIAALVKYLLSVGKG